MFMTETVRPMVKPNYIQLQALQVVHASGVVGFPNFNLTITCKKQCNRCDDFMEEMRGVERYEPVRSCLPEVRYGVPAHRHQQGGVSKHHDAGGPAGHRHPKSGYPPQTSVFTLIRKI